MKGAAVSAAPGARDPGASPDALRREVGRLARDLHEGLRTLRYDAARERAAAEHNGTRDRLAHLTAPTEHATSRVLNACAVITPLQAQLTEGAAKLARDWRALLDSGGSQAEMERMAQATCQFLGLVQQAATTTRAQVSEIVVSQEFQDQTGQAVRNASDLVHRFESRLLQVLIDCAPDRERDAAGRHRLEGPRIAPGDDSEVAVNRDRVYELLASLGF